MRHPRQIPEIFRAAVALLAAGCLAGCAGGKGGSQVGHYSVRVPQTAMYRYGPAQNFGADFNLTQGQHVVMLGKDYGYSRVMTDDGQSGYVATEDLTPVAPPVVEKPKRTGFFASAPPLPARGNRGGGGSERILQGAPLFGTGEGDLDPLPPLPDDKPTPGAPEKKSAGKPGFRVNVRPPSGPTVSGKTEGKPEKKNSDTGTPGFRVNIPTR